MKDLTNKLLEILGPNRCLSEQEDLICYSCDLFAKALPELVVVPETTEEVSKILQLANEYGVSVTPRGAGTSLTGGPVPVKGGILMSLTKMDNILEISPADKLVVAQAGVITGKLQREVAKQNLFYPPNPTSADYCTIGGNVATNAGGASGVKYGVTGDYLMAVTAVLASGEIIRTGSRCIKSVTGFDFASLLCGSEGMLAVITEVTLKLISQPLGISTSLTYFPTLESAGKAVYEMMTGGLVPSTMELMDEGFLKAVSEVYQIEMVDSAAAAILIEFDDDAPLLEGQQKQVQDICLAQGALEFSIASNDQERQILWQARRGGTAALVKNAKFMQSLDYAVPLSKLCEGIAGVREITDRNNLKMVLIGHAGDGNLHPMVIFDPTDAKQKATFLQAEQEMSEFFVSIGGTLSGEHGIGLEKEQYLSLELSDVEIKLSNKLKNIFDPGLILNPGKCGF